MREAVSRETGRTAQDRSLGGALAFVGMLVAGLLAVSYPAVMVGVGLGLLLGLGLPLASRVARRWTAPTLPADSNRARLSG